MDDGFRKRVDDANAEVSGIGNLFGDGMDTKEDTELTDEQFEALVSSAPVAQQQPAPQQLPQKQAAPVQKPAPKPAPVAPQQQRTIVQAPRQSQTVAPQRPKKNRKEVPPNER